MGIDGLDQSEVKLTNELQVPIDLLQHRIDDQRLATRTAGQEIGVSAGRAVKELAEDHGGLDFWASMWRFAGVSPLQTYFHRYRTFGGLPPIKVSHEMYQEVDSMNNRVFLDDCERIHQGWHECAKSRDTDGLLALYAEEAVFESPLVQAILEGRASGTLRGHREIRPFFEEGARRRPNELVRWHRTGRWLTDGERLLVWEYPREAPDGDQVDLVEVVEVADGL